MIIYKLAQADTQKTLTDMCTYTHMVYPGSNEFLWASDQRKEKKGSGCNQKKKGAGQVTIY